MVRLKCLLFEETLARVLQACKKTFLFYWRNRYSTGRSCSKADQLLTPHARKGDTRRGERKMKPFLAWGGFHARSRFARSTIPKEKWMTTRSLQYCSFTRPSGLRHFEKFSGNFIEVCDFLNVILCCVYSYFRYFCAVLCYSYPPYALLLGEPELRETRGKQALRFEGNKINWLPEGSLISDFL